ncbi:N-acetylneuraminate synthase, partial [bacterium]
MVTPIEIAGRRVGPDQPCFIIAEAGVNHNGDQKLAKQLVDVAVEVGADAVKFQTFNAERLVTPDAPKATYQLETTAASESQLEMLRRLELSPEVQRELMDYCRQRGILFMSTPFDEESADFLAELPVEVFKIPSGE